ncbi:GIY-YIG nuclease family protein [Echinicola jeungdonensis]|uniref:GIY-YIG nuclease family protein n=1 Tax=Echinicola jeungdonensis TaxID=709343 RepID=A0ABV5J2Q9_9BACT|nr:GIY-YIG nuclease family protein [Echinicola jeungdonensis]MDN3671100.1 GIY-YIG nuclease family protein [Echinicola jeungdonensis]
MISFVYILFSEKMNRFYTGITTLSIKERLENHIKKKYSRLNFTHKAEDWKLVWELECISYSQARKIEIHIKKMKSKVYIQNLLKYPEMKRKLQSQFHE